MKKKLLQEVIDSLIKEEYQRFLFESLLDEQLTSPWDAYSNINNWTVDQLIGLGGSLSGVAGNGIQEPRATQRGMPTPTGTQMPTPTGTQMRTPTDMSEVGNNINQINSAIQEFRRDFERQTAEIKRQMQSANSPTVTNTGSNPNSSTSTTGTK